MTEKDVSKHVRFDYNDMEISLPTLLIEKCLCGARDEDGLFRINKLPWAAKSCPRCGVKLYFDVQIRIHQVEEA